MKNRVSIDFKYKCIPYTRILDATFEILSVQLSSLRIKVFFYNIETYRNEA